MYTYMKDKQNKGNVCLCACTYAFMCVFYKRVIDNIFETLSV